MRKIIVHTEYLFKTDEAFKAYLAYLKKGPLPENRKTAEALERNESFIFEHDTLSEHSKTSYSLAVEGPIKDYCCDGM